MRVAVNAWFLNAPTTGSGQYLTSLTAALRELAPDLELLMIEPRARGKLAKVWFEQVGFPLAAARLKADLAWVPVVAQTKVGRRCDAHLRAHAIGSPGAHRLSAVADHSDVHGRV